MLQNTGQVHELCGLGMPCQQAEDRLPLGKARFPSSIKPLCLLGQQPWAGENDFCQCTLEQSDVLTPFRYEQWIRKKQVTFSLKVVKSPVDPAPYATHKNRPQFHKFGD